MDYKAFNEKDNENYREYYLKCLQMTADMTPFNLLSLRGEPAHIKRAYGYGLCFHQGVVGDQTINFCPVGEWDSVDWKEIFEKEYSKDTYFWGIPELLMKKWQDSLGDTIEVEESRDDWDYLWYTKRMGEADGGSFRSYRRAMKNIMNNHNCVMESVKREGFDEIRRFHRLQTDLLRERTQASDMVDFDDQTFNTVLEYWDENYLYGTIYRVDGEMGGVLINEIIDVNNVVGLYQKQERKFKGLTEYMYISDCLYLMEKGYLLYNVMSDVGSEGLRAAKLRSNPLVLLKKYNITYH